MYLNSDLGRQDNQDEQPFRMEFRRLPKVDVQDQRNELLISGYILDHVHVPVLKSACYH